MLQIYNSLSKQKEPFKTLEPGKVRMYVCGMTVYDYCHLGHARAMVVFDMVVRYLRALGYEVTYVRNITDIDDKIIRRAHEAGEDFTSLTERFTAAMHEDAEALGVLPPDHEPRATQAMDAIVDMIETLIERGYAYVAPSGDVYYSVAKFAGYGKLSGERLEDLRAGARIEPGEDKRDPVDFVLWKAAKPGEPSWGSPWGQGRPGWHIECSAMSTCCLGHQFDIHGGGMDLKFPHHENEIAQSEAATGHNYVNYWMHNGHVRIDEEKMSKSLGNFLTVRQILARYRAEEVRYFLLSSHYRSPLNFSDEALANAGSAVERLYLALRGLPSVQPSAAAGETFKQRFHEAMEDDFNTPPALAVLFELAREINRQRAGNSQQAAELGAVLKSLGGVLGLLQEEPEAYLKGAEAVSGEGLDAQHIEAMIAARAAARKARDFAEADRIRDALKADGVIIEDTVEGTSWRRE
ncbi:cysteine--tRNA ligase [Alkalilimnicola ehrlichii]|uniref:Cysteine--tRNA ligase n=1 Tax=Alkalilimnicola ehrlichii TaxID=351052 RepID=A0A3E0X2K1_9GAMM|nr:cysteine--tRNA ligase [Alkalilimnicola ehrlichii]RFA30872.1 cysteine--tRNA ligase [Alkalilimnicola ehrlichii]RFA38823.1 cysteine--tRNA ligase [Alkalilimnicola ehrlichii]